MRMWRWLVLGAVVVFGSFGCAAPRVPESPKRVVESAPRAIEAAALALLPVDRWPEARLMRQRVEIEWESGRERFDAVLQKRPGELALIGLGPMNVVGFRLALLGADRIEFENRSGRALPFSPSHILADVQRVFYPWLQGEPERDTCTRAGRSGDVVVRERWLGHRLAERRFALVGRPERGEVRIRYARWRSSTTEILHPERVELTNDWFGYRLVIETLEARPLDASNEGGGSLGREGR